jgi:hypothetical protein
VHRSNSSGDVTGVTGTQNSQAHSLSKENRLKVAQLNSDLYRLHFYVKGIGCHLQGCSQFHCNLSLCSQKNFVTVHETWPIRFLHNSFQFTIQSCNHMISSRKDYTDLYGFFLNFWPFPPHTHTHTTTPPPKRSQLTLPVYHAGCLVWYH